MFVKTSSKSVPITRELAATHSGLNPCPGDRPIIPRRLKLLQQQVRKGNFSTALWVVAYCKENDQIYRVNGKHTSTVMSDPDIPLPDKVQVVLEEFECDTVDDVRALYATFDTRESVRTQSEINQTFFADDSILGSLDKRILNTLVSGALFSDNPEGYHNLKLTAAERAEYARKICKDIVWVASLAIAAPTEFTRKMNRAPVIAAMINTYRKNPVKADLFWKSVCDGNGSEDPDHPTRKLERYLLDFILLRHDGAATRSRKYTTSIKMYGKCIRFWNQYAKASRPMAARVSHEIPEVD